MHESIKNYALTPLADLKNYALTPLADLAIPETQATPETVETRPTPGIPLIVAIPEIQATPVIHVTQSGAATTMSLKNVKMGIGLHGMIVKHKEWFVS